MNQENMTIMIESMKNVLLYVVGTLLLVSIPVTVFFVGKNQELRQKAAPATTLAITPASVSLKAGETTVLTIEIDTAENRVATAKLSLTYDTTKLEAQSITNGPLAPRILSPGVVAPGMAAITVGAENTAKPISGRGGIALLRIKGLDSAQGPASVQFAADTQAAGIGEQPVNVLIGSTGATVTIQGTQLGLTGMGGPPASLSGTLTPTPSTPVAGTPTPTQMKESSVSAMLSVSVSENASNSARPIIKGKGIPGSTITIIVHSNGSITDTVTVDANGNWQYVPNTDLTAGDHTVVVTGETAAGVPASSNSTFTVSGTGGSPEEEATLSAMPESGSMEAVWQLILAAGSLIFLGIYFPWFNKRL
jgi:hypothetical protein